MSHKSIKLNLKTIISGCLHIHHEQPFIWAVRGFDSPQSHADFIIAELARYFSDNPDASFICLGDGFLNSTPEKALSCIKQWRIPTYYIDGNHEGPTSQLRKSLGDKFENIEFLGPQATFSIEKQLIFAHHFPLAIWDKSHHGVWHIHSHCHGSFKESLPNYLDLKRLDCGVDVCLRNFSKPYLTFEQLKVIMNRKKVHCVDHHNEKTN